MWSICLPRPIILGRILLLNHILQFVQELTADAKMLAKYILNHLSVILGDKIFGPINIHFLCFLLTNFARTKNNKLFQEHTNVFLHYIYFNKQLETILDHTSPDLYQQWLISGFTRNTNKNYPLSISHFRSFPQPQPILTFF